jgi:hypothetical protein
MKIGGNVWQNSQEVKMIFSAQCCFAKCRAAYMEHFCTVSMYDNGRGSAVNIALDGSTYPGQKLVPSSLCPKNLTC